MCLEALGEEFSLGGLGGGGSRKRWSLVKLWEDLNFKFKSKFNHGFNNIAVRYSKRCIQI